MGLALIPRDLASERRSYGKEARSLAPSHGTGRGINCEMEAVEGNEEEEEEE